MVTLNYGLPDAANFVKLEAGCKTITAEVLVTWRENGYLKTSGALMPKIMTFAIASLLFVIGNGSVRFQLPDITMVIGGTPERFVLIIIGLWLLHMLLDKQVRERSLSIGFELPVIGLLLIIGALLSFHPLENVLDTLILLTGLIFSVVIAVELTSKRAVTIAMIGIAAGTVMTIGLVIQNFFSGGPLMPGVLSDVRTSFGSTAEISLFVITAWSLTTGLCILSDTRRRRTYWMVFHAGVLITAFLVLTPGIVAAGLFGAVLVMLSRRQILSLHWGLYLFLMTLVAGSLAWSWWRETEGGIFILSSVFHSGVSGAIEENLNLVISTLCDYPLSGLGLGNEARVFLLTTYQRTNFPISGNLYTTWLISTGMIGLLIVVLLVRSIRRRTTVTIEGESDRWRESLEVATMQAIVAFILAGTMVNPLSNAKTMFLLWAIFGLRLVCIRKFPGSRSEMSAGV